ncbi:hypothetical protein PF010_g24460 [Phytophthora fragariae]|uniref:Uncharacterized protein n=2 Tax=Phytophthora TaxID=4783 RepID=A0A6A4F4U7_9STRA|nr:hypothetical protein PF010_g24460 [Phytophthora fragariae]KAE9332441.1 hypothetical protein PR003_g14517 [Phytophthora rubi]
MDAFALSNTALGITTPASAASVEGTVHASCTYLRLPRWQRSRTRSQPPRGPPHGQSVRSFALGFID